MRCPSLGLMGWQISANLGRHVHAGAGARLALTWRNGHSMAKNRDKRIARSRRQSQPHPLRSRSVAVEVVAVEVGFEPTEGLPPHTLSSTAHQRSPMAATVRDLPGHDWGGRW